MNVESAPSMPEATRHAYEVVLRRRGRGLDAYQGFFHRLHLAAPREASVRTYLEAVRKASEDSLHDPSSDARGSRDALMEQERRLGTTLGTPPAPAREATLSPVQAAMPTGSVLLEYVKYIPLDPQILAFDNPATPAFALYVVSKDAPLRVVKLARSAAEIRATASRLAAELRNPVNDFRDSAQQLYRDLLLPVQKEIAGASRLFVVPDDELNRIPYAALVDPDGRFLAQTTEVVYLTSGRDLIRPAGNVSKRGSVLVGDPAFTRGSRAGSSHSNIPGPSLIELGIPAEVEDLPDTEAEMTAVGRAIGGHFKRLARETATEEQVKVIQSPRVLHIATHGFFARTAAAPSRLTANDEVARFLQQGESWANALRPDDGMLYSGLALAGFNGRDDGAGNDGFLSAIEFAGLDLRGTQLVVLSACETGAGVALAGDGIYGLRRAVLLSGARTVVSTLWKIDSPVTIAFMMRFYGALRSGTGGAGAALLEAQRDFIKDPRYAHPYYWGAFSVAGDWRPLGR